MPPHSALPDLGAFTRLRASIDPEWIDEALEATGTATIRRRRLPAEQVLWLVLGMALCRDRPIDELVEKLGLVLPGTGRSSMAKSAVCQARARLGEEPVKWLFERCARKWGHESARRHEWRGLALYGVDGTTVRVPDSADNRGFFGDHYSGEQKGLSGYPLARVVTLMALRSHILAGASIGPYEDERKMALDLWPCVPDNSLVIVDRGFRAANVLIPLHCSASQKHWLTRARADNKWRIIKKLGRGDDLIEAVVSAGARRKDPSLPRTWQMRAIQYQRPGFPPQTLLTSLCDSKAYPARELRELYHERWEIELGFNEIKTIMLERQEAIRSRTPPGAMQELWAIGLVYNLIRLEMEQVAKQADVAPTRISFILSMRYIRDEWEWSVISKSPGAIPAHLRRLRDELTRFVLPPRRLRYFPRAVKIKMSGYARKRPVALK
jgi:hypothetical protein